MSVQADEIPQTYSDAVSLMTKWQGESGPADVRIFWFPDPAGESIRFVEVSGEFLATGRVQPLPLGVSPEFPFRSAVALATPEEWERVERGELPLPEGWELESRRGVWP